MKTYDMSTGQPIDDEPLPCKRKASKTAVSCPPFASEMLPGLSSVQTGQAPDTSRPLPADLAMLDLDVFLSIQ